MRNIIYTGFILATIIFLIKYLPTFISKKNRDEFLNEFDKLNIFLEWSFVVISVTTFISISIYFKNLTAIAIVFLSIIFGSILISYNFFIYPFLIKFRKNKFNISDFYQKWARENVKSDLSIRIFNRNIINAYATGIFSNSKVILLSKKLVETMEEEDIQNLILHEYGHLKKNHLLILFFANVFCCSLSIISSKQLYPIFETTKYPGLYVALHGAIYGALFILIPGIVQRKLEFDADKFASLKSNSKSYINTLNNLNKITNGGLEKKAINYPTLNERINNVKEI